MKRALVLFFGLLPFLVGLWVIDDLGAAANKNANPKTWPCPTQRYLRADLAVINHPDIFKWRFAKKAPEVVATPVPTPEVKQTPVTPTRKPLPEEWSPLPEKTVYFDYDKAVLKPESKAAIQKNAQFLKEHASAKVLLEGHCDERGTSEYNMALGERRAEAVKNYMVDLGVSAERITTKSWGKEKPVELGHNEKAWSKNRRAEMFFSEQGGKAIETKATAVEPKKETKPVKKPAVVKKAAPQKAKPKAAAPKKEVKKEAAPKKEAPKAEAKKEVKKEAPPKKEAPLTAPKKETKSDANKEEVKK